MQKQFIAGGRPDEASENMNQLHRISFEQPSGEATSSGKQGQRKMVQQVRSLSAYREQQQAVQNARTYNDSMM